MQGIGIGKDRMIRNTPHRSISMNDDIIRHDNVGSAQHHYYHRMSSSGHIDSLANKNMARQRKQKGMLVMRGVCVEEQQQDGTTGNIINMSNKNAYHNVHQGGMYGTIIGGKALRGEIMMLPTTNDKTSTSRMMAGEEIKKTTSPMVSSVVRESREPNDSV